MPVMTQQTPGPDLRLAEELARRLEPGSVCRAREPLAKKTTLRVGGPADVYVEPASESDLSRVLAFCQERGLPLLLLGRGSNLLIRDGGIRGVVVSLAHPSFCVVRVEGTRLRCGAGARLKAVSNEARRASITGLEFLEGIPGNIGGALRMNAGAMGSSMFQVLESVRAMDRAGKATEIPARQIPVEYRDCRFFLDHIALEAVLTGEAASAGEIEKKMRANNQKRWDSQPAAPSAGCIFKNSATVPSGRLVEELGLKGTRIGGAAVSDLHGNFIVNEANASARDVLNLIDLIKQKALRERGIELETEVQIIGEEADPSPV